MDRESATLGEGNYEIVNARRARQYPKPDAPKLHLHAKTQRAQSFFLASRLVSWRLCVAFLFLELILFRAASYFFCRTHSNSRRSLGSRTTLAGGNGRSSWYVWRRSVSAIPVNTR